MSRHERERRRAPSLPRCSECRKAVAPQDNINARPGAVRWGRSALHEKCCLNANRHHLGEATANRHRRARLVQSRTARFGIVAAHVCDDGDCRCRS